MSVKSRIGIIFSLVWRSLLSCRCRCVYETNDGVRVEYSHEEGISVKLEEEVCNSNVQVVQV